MTLATLADRAIQWVTGRPPVPPSFDGLLAELFAIWPLDEEDLVEEYATIPFRRAA